MFVSSLEYHYGPIANIIIMMTVFNRGVSKSKHCLDTTNVNPSSVRDFNTNKILGSEFDYKCQSGFVLFVSKNGGAYERASSDSITYECLRSTGSTFDPSIRENGRPKCMS